MERKASRSAWWIGRIPPASPGATEFELPCTGRRNSLFDSVGNFARKPLTCGTFDPAQNRRFSDFPCIFPWSRESPNGDQFACDCVHHHFSNARRYLARHTSRPWARRGARVATKAMHLALLG